MDEDAFEQDDDDVEEDAELLEMLAGKSLFNLEYFSRLLLNDLFELTNTKSLLGSNTRMAFMLTRTFSLGLVCCWLVGSFVVASVASLLILS